MSDSKTDPATSVKEKVYPSEVWVLQGHSWRLPLLVTWPEQFDVAFVKPHPIIRDIKSMLRVANDTLTPLECRSDPDGWWVQSKALHQVAQRAHNREPDELIYWINPKEYAGTSIHVMKDEKGAAERSEFFNRLLSRLSIPWITSVQDMEVLWRIFCGAMMDWLVNEQKPIDLMFCTLHPSPFRNGWARIWQNRNGWSEKFTGSLHPSYHAFSKTAKVCYWFLEVIPKKNWWRSTRKAEKVRRSEYGSKRYLKYWLKIRDRLREQTKALYSAWRCQANLSSRNPYLDHVLGRTSPSHPGRKRQIIRDRKNNSVHIVWQSKERPNYRIGAVEKKAYNVRALRHLRFKKTDMRDRVAQCLITYDEYVDSLGLLLCDVVGGEASSQKLLGVGNISWRWHRMDDGFEWRLAPTEPPKIQADSPSVNSGACHLELNEQH
jgi:hypothetical protein